MTTLKLNKDKCEEYHIQCCKVFHFIEGGGGPYFNKSKQGVYMGKHHF